LALATDTIRRRVTAWLALAALLVQFAASFGHFHAQEYAALLGPHGTPVLASDRGTTPSDLAADEDCAICASIFLVGSSPVPDFVIVAAPAEIRLPAPLFLAALRLSAPAYSLFRTRAPPVV